MGETNIGSRTTQRPTEGTLVTTLFEVVGALVATGATDTEVIAVLRSMLRWGRVRLVGEFQEHHIRECWEPVQTPGPLPCEAACTGPGPNEGALLDAGLLWLKEGAVTEHCVQDPAELVGHRNDGTLVAMVGGELCEEGVQGVRGSRA